MDNIGDLEKRLKLSREDMVAAVDQGDQMLAMFDGLTACHASIATSLGILVAETHLLRQAIEDKPDA